MFTAGGVLCILQSMAPHGRKYTEKVHETIVKAIREGNSKSTAFKLAGLGMDGQLGFDWCALGRQYPDRYPEYVKLAEDIVHARAEFEASRVALVKTAGDTGTWQAAAWWLERTNPEEWGRNQTVKLEGGERIGQQVNIVVLENPEAREAARGLLRGLAGLEASRPDITIGPRALLEPAEDEEG